MTKRINVSIPDSLAERIEEHRGYLGNLSEIFQEAVDEKITTRENFQKRIREDQDMESIVERLRAERSQSYVDYYEKGRDEGLVWAKAASYMELTAALSHAYQTGQPKALIFEGKDAVSKYLRETLTDDPLLMQRHGWQGELFSEYAEKWLGGWFEAVCDFWEDVQVMLEDD